MISASGAKSLHWTFHVRAKMRQYHLSAQRVKAILHSPKRVEEGVATKTIAAMKPVSVSLVNGRESWSQEHWVMVQDKGGKRIVISAWRYPGVTKPRSAVAMQMLKHELNDYAKTIVPEPRKEWRIGVPKRKLAVPKNWKWMRRPFKKPTGPRAVQLD
jgi:hypothetical protein